MCARSKGRKCMCVPVCAWILQQRLLYVLPYKCAITDDYQQPLSLFTCHNGQY